MYDTDLVGKLALSGPRSHVMCSLLPTRVNADLKFKKENYALLARKDFEVARLLP